MLNEIREFEQYSFNLDAPIDKANCRLKYAKLTDELSGRERAMTVVARWYIFKDDPEGKTFNENNVKNFLVSWCGFDNESKKPEYPNLDKWFIRYIRNAFFNYHVNECINEFQAKNLLNTEVYKILKSLSVNLEIDVIKRKCFEIMQIKEFEKNSNLKKLYKAKECLVYASSDSARSPKNLFFQTMFPEKAKTDNDFRVIYYDRIIANALQMGKLQQYYLFCDIDPFERRIIAKARNNGTHTLKLLPNDKDFLLKITAYYLLQKKNLIHGQNFVFFNKTDLINWLVPADPKLDKDKLKKYILTDSSDTLISTMNFKENNSKGMNYTKLKLDYEWIKHFKIVNSQDIDKPENQGGIFYSDFGSSALLQKGKRYS